MTTIETVTPMTKDEIESKKQEILDDFASLPDEDKAEVFNKILLGGYTEVKSKGLKAWCAEHWKALMAGGLAVATGALALFGLTGCSVTPEQAEALLKIQQMVIKVDKSDIK